MKATYALVATVGYGGSGLFEVNSRVSKQLKVMGFAFGEIRADDFLGSFVNS